MIRAIRKALYNFARDHIKPDPPKELLPPEVGHVTYDEAETWGRYCGDAMFPPNTDLNDAAAFSMVQSALWILSQDGMHGKLKTDGFRYTINWKIEYEPLDESLKEDTVYMDPEGIRNMVTAMLEAAAYLPDEAPTEPPKEGIAISMEDARNRLRGEPS